MSITPEDIGFMKRAVELSEKGCCDARPNPLVGAVIVKEGKVIGEGYHQKFGEAHAEVNAINNAKESVRGATMYVTLEPCSHYGKTPPCADRIIAEGFSEVVVGMTDPNPLVKGKGIAKLEAAGIKVKVSVIEDIIRKTNEIYLKNIELKRPFCVLKTAMTLDGKIASKTGDSKWISGDKSRNYVHELRHRYDGILIGVNTIITDNPQLTDRSDHEKKRHPVRIVADSSGRIPLNSKVLNDNGRTIVAVTDKAGANFISKIEEKGKEIVICPAKEGKTDLGFLMKELYRLGIDSILIEGGGTLNWSAVSCGIVDKVLSFIAPEIVGGIDAVTPVEGVGYDNIAGSLKLKIDSLQKIGKDILIESYVHRID